MVSATVIPQPRIDHSTPGARYVEVRNSETGEVIGGYYTTQPAE